MGVRPSRRTLTREGRAVTAWAVDVLTAFYGDDWFASAIDKHDAPMMNVNEWPLRNPRAVVCVLERACRIGLLDESAYAVLHDAARGQTATDFRHMDVVLEIAGLAQRDGWVATMDKELGSRKKPDVTLDRLGSRFTIEVTTQGFSGPFRKLQSFGYRVTDLIHAAELEFEVEISTDSTSMLDDITLNAWAQQLRSTSADVNSSGQARSFQLAAVSTTVYPHGERPDGTIYSGPSDGRDEWPRFAVRLREKAGQTVGAGPTWIRIDEVGGLIQLSDKAYLPLDEQLAILSSNVSIELEEFRHVRGVVIGLGVGPDWTSTGDVTVGEKGRPNIWTGGMVIERKLPGNRKRRTYIVPVESGRLILPDSTELMPARWYDREASWLDWALLTLKFPPEARLIER